MSPTSGPAHDDAAVQGCVPAPGPAEPPVIEGRRARQVAGVVACELRDELLVYAPDRELAFSLNRSARAVWELCEDRTAREISEILGQRLGVGSGALLPDVTDTVRRFQELGLLEQER